MIVDGAVRRGPIHYHDISLAKRFTTVRAIRQFQQANNVFTVELARRLHADEIPVTITCLQPGMVATNIRRGLPQWMRWAVTLAGPLMELVLSVAQRDTAPARIGTAHRLRHGYGRLGQAQPAGADVDPARVHNLRANPRAHVEVGTDSIDVIARELPPAERSHAWTQIIDAEPGFAEYQARTSRVLPIFELRPV